MLYFKEPKDLTLGLLFFLECKCCT